VIKKLLIVLLCLYPLTSIADGRDGIWWQRQDIALKTTYVAGLIDGLMMGSKFVVNTCFDKMESDYEKLGKKNADDIASDCVNKIGSDYHKQETKFLANKAPGAVVTAMDSYYVDHRNLIIPANNVMFLVLRASNGDIPDSEEMQFNRDWYNKHQKQ
jgi:hypothetical protein